MAKIRLVNVVRQYAPRGARAVDGVSLEASDGQILTVLGPSGCGKSTLLRLIAGLEQPDAGEVWIGDRCVNGVEPRDRDVAMVFQSYALYPHMNAFDNIAVSLRLRRVPNDQVRRRVEEAAGKLGIAHLLGRYPREMSGGERQRVAVARALVRNPQVFLLDEPLSNLDASLRERTRAELKSLFQQLRATVVYVTHDQIEAMTLSDRVAVMRAGRLEQLGTPEEIYRRPATVFVAGFVGSPGMNLLRGEAVGVAACTVGIRPEDVVVAEQGEFAMQVVLRENLGAHTLVTLRGGSFELRALVPSDRGIGTAIRVSLPRNRMHLFDTDGRRIGP